MIVRGSKERRLFERMELLVGVEAMDALAATRVALFGLGGVGSWCAEGLARNGIGQVTLVDGDVITPSNVNRQLIATAHNTGEAKVDAAAARLSQINPSATFVPRKEEFNPSSESGFDLDSHDYVIDAIDTLNNKVTLIESAMRSPATLFSALGASRKLDPTRVQSGSFWAVTGCPLGKHLRKRLRNRGATEDFVCVFSEENLPRPGAADEAPEDWTDDGHKQINGSSVHVTAVFGMILAGLVVDSVLGKVRGSASSR